MRCEFKRTINALEEIFRFTSQFFSDSDVQKTMQLSVDLLIEEIFTNIIKYSPNSDELISIDITLSKEAITVSMIETDAEPFDMTAGSQGLVKTSNGVPVPGGLGLQLVESIADNTSYEYDKDNRTSTVNMIFYLEK